MATASYDLCPWCDGTGDRGSDFQCAHCNGTGMVDLNDFAEEDIEDWPDEEPRS